MDFSTVKSIAIPEGEVAEISCDGVALWKSGYTNLVPLSTEVDGITIYNGGLGYMNGFRVRSAGELGEAGLASHTGYIVAKGGDVVRLSGYAVKERGTANAINVYDENHSNLGQITANTSYSYFCFEGTVHNWDEVIFEGTDSKGNDVYYWIVPDGYGIEYIRVTGYTGYQDEETDGSKMIVTVNEEIV